MEENIHFVEKQVCKNCAWNSTAKECPYKKKFRLLGDLIASVMHIYKMDDFSVDIKCNKFL